MLSYNRNQLKHRCNKCGKYRHKANDPECLENNNEENNKKKNSGKK